MKTNTEFITHLPSAIAKFWIGIKDPKELIIELRHDANWIESKLEVEVKQREENEKRDGWFSITQYMDIKRSEWDLVINKSFSNT